jgi:hypothetical protein
VIDGTSGPDGSTYVFSVDGSLARSSEPGEAAGDALSDSSVVKRVNDDIDVYHFSGSVTSSVLDGTADVRFDRVE